MSGTELVKEYWEEEVCGTRLGDTVDAYEALKACEYHITAELAEYPAWAGRNVLEIGVGGGSDFLKFVRAGADATGVDLTDAAVSMVRDRLRSEGLQAECRQADAEDLDLPDATFDLVYSYGVLHHSGDPDRAFREVFRVLRPGGEFRGMVYSDFSACGTFLWGVYGLLKGRPFRSQRDIIYHHLESPGTKSYGTAEFGRVLEAAGFEVERLYKRACSGDLLIMPPSAKYASGLKRVLFRTAQVLLPRFLIRRFENQLGMGLCFVARRPR